MHSSGKHQYASGNDENANVLFSSSTKESTPLLTSPSITKTGQTAKNNGVPYALNDVDEEAIFLQKDRHADVTPSWMEMVGKITPFLVPASVRQTTFAIIALVSVLVSKFINVLPPLAIKHAVDVITDEDADSPTRAKSITLAIAVFFGLKVLCMSVDTVQSLTQRIVSIDAERRFATSIFSHLHFLSVSYHLEKHIGEIVNVMNRGADSVSTFIDSIVFFIGPLVVEVVIVSAVFWKLGTPAVALSTAITVVLYLTCTILVTKTRVDFRRKLNEASDAVSQQEMETLVNYETVSMFGRTKYEIKRYNILRQAYMDRRVDMLSLFSMIELAQKSIRVTGVCVGLVIAGHATVYGDPPLSSGSFVAVQMYIDQLFQPLTNLGRQYRMLTKAFTDLEKAVTMLNRIPDIQDAPNASDWAHSPGCPSGEIVFDDVSFRYKTASRRRCLGASLVDISAGNPGQRGSGRARKRLYRGMANNAKVQGSNKITEHGDVNKDENHDTSKETRGGISKTSFRVPAGSTVALVGPSGSGKTTIVRLVLRMYDSDEGSVYVDGQNVKHLTQQSLRENIGVVAQETVLFNASLRDNITYGKENTSEEEIWRAARIASLEAFILGLPDKLDTLCGERGLKLSGGERQRVGLARCVIKDPKLILLDEATSALDTLTEREIQKNIGTVCQGRTTLMIAHRLSTARFASQIIVLEDGEICEKGTHDELLVQNGSYAKLWRAQTDISG